jgi:tRNAThr (cytosine32-N3)-methyltransferase
MSTAGVEGNVTPSIDDALAEQTSQLAVTNEAEDVPAHRSHDPAKNKKRSDPFQFGNRFLSKEDDVFEFNAWDHVETDDDYKEWAATQYAMQRASPVSDFDKGMRYLLCFPLPLAIMMIINNSIVHLNWFS